MPSYYSKQLSATVDDLTLLYRLDQNIVHIIVSPCNSQEQIFNESYLWNWSFHELGNSLPNILDTDKYIGDISKNSSDDSNRHVLKAYYHFLKHFTNYAKF